MTSKYLIERSDDRFNITTEEAAIKSVEDGTDKVYQIVRGAKGKLTLKRCYAYQITETTVPVKSFG